MYSSAFPAAAFGVETSASGGFLPGGFGNMQQESDPYGGGGTVPSIYNPYLASASDTHARKCLPLNISMIYRAYNQNPGARVIMNGEEVGHFKLVGRVTKFQNVKDGGAQKYLFDLVDDTGVIRVEFLVDVNTDESSSYRRRIYEEFQARTAEHYYVKVFGECNLRGVHELKVRANQLHMIRNMLEVEYHKVDVMLAHLTQPGSAMAARYIQLKSDPAVLADIQKSIFSSSSPPIPASEPTWKPPGDGQTRLGDAQSRFSVLQPPPSVQRSAAPTPVRPSTASSLPPAQQTPLNPTPQTIKAPDDINSRIHHFLLEMQESHPNGVHVKIIAHNVSSTVEQVREALQALEDTGDVYYGKSMDWWKAI